MSVTTTADEKITKVKQLLSESYKELLICLDEDTWGYEEFDEEYIDKIQKVAFELIKLKRML